MELQVSQTAQALGAAAARHAAERIRDLTATHGLVAVVFATGASQLETLRALVQISDVPWHKVTGFHMDEYIGISGQHPASFRRYLREQLVRHVPLRQFYAIEGDAANALDVCQRYAALLREHNPLLCLAGIGENGHLAFNDPGEADFHDPHDAKVVTLDQACRQQQVSEGWFPSLVDVPGQAITLTIPCLLRIPELILSVPGERKREIIDRTLSEPVSTACPATILRNHPGTHLYVDAASYRGQR